jgi:hypothetical protein
MILRWNCIFVSYINCIYHRLFSPPFSLPEIMQLLIWAIDWAMNWAINWAMVDSLNFTKYYFNFYEFLGLIPLSC